MDGLTTAKSQSLTYTSNLLSMSPFKTFPSFPYLEYLNYDCDRENTDIHPTDLSSIRNLGLY